MDFDALPADFFDQCNVYSPSGERCSMQAGHESDHSWELEWEEYCQSKSDPYDEAHGYDQ